MRRGHAALRIGSFRTVLADDDQDLWVFERELGAEALLVALNASSKAAQFDLPAAPGSDWVPALGASPVGSSDSPSTAHVGPIAGRVWTRRIVRD